MMACAHSTMCAAFIARRVRAVTAATGTKTRPAIAPALARARWAETPVRVQSGCSADEHGWGSWRVRRPWSTSAPGLTAKARLFAQGSECVVPAGTASRPVPLRRRHAHRRVCRFLMVTEPNRFSNPNRYDSMPRRSPTPFPKNIRDGGTSPRRGAVSLDPRSGRLIVACRTPSPAECFCR